jgi:myo-inositol-1-phosphate synthase
MRRPTTIAPPEGKLGVLTCGMGAVATTFMAGVDLIRANGAQPIGSVTQLGTIRLGKRTEHRTPPIKDFVSLATLDDLVFGGWDLFPDSAYDAAANAAVLSPEDLMQAKKFLTAIRPMKAAFNRDYVKRLDGPHVKKAKNKYELALEIKEDIARFRKQSKAARLVVI